jgi:hypothetical protein
MPNTVRHKNQQHASAKAREERFKVRHSLAKAVDRVDVQAATRQKEVA